MFSPEAFAWLARYTGSDAPIELAPLKGATSSSIYLVRAEDQAQPFVLRVLDNARWLAQEPDLAAHEAAALGEARRARLRAPRLVAYADEAGFGAPVVLMTFVEGRVELRPDDFGGWLAEQAIELARIHRHPAEGLPWRFESWVDLDALAPPAWSGKPAAWTRAIEVVLAGPPAAPPVFIHRDYHPLNVLWQGGAISGVVDWINACRGPAGVDVAHCRTNLAQMYGPRAADEFLELYRAAVPGFEYHPYWDLDSLLDMTLPDLDVYPPWRDFGLESLTAEMLRARVDAYLEGVLERM
jgi:aminoglycoside phosphotransferase (APT) family kinase protein